MVLNWRRTSSTMASAALPTLFIVIALNQYGSIAPTSSPANTCRRARAWLEGPQLDDADQGNTQSEQRQALPTPVTAM